MTAVDCGCGELTQLGAVVPPWLVWTARTVGRGSGAAVGLRVFHDTQQATFEPGKTWWSNAGGLVVKSANFTITLNHLIMSH